MAAFKSGERKGTIMDRIVKGFTPEEIEQFRKMLDQLEIDRPRKKGR